MGWISGPSKLQKGSKIGRGPLEGSTFVGRLWGSIYDRRRRSIYQCNLDILPSPLSIFLFFKWLKSSGRGFSHNSGLIDTGPLTVSFPQNSFLPITASFSSHSTFPFSAVHPLRLRLSDKSRRTFYDGLTDVQQDILTDQSIGSRGHLKGRKAGSLGPEKDIGNEFLAVHKGKWSQILFHSATVLIEFEKGHRKV